MIKTSFELTKLDTVEPFNDPSVFAMPIPPTERIKSFSPEAFEAFIAEWGISCAKPIYKDVFRVGGAGDMGRDVIAEYDDGAFDYYQCKRYEGKLTPSEYWLEFGKLCYYTFNNDIPLPKKYYIIASQGLGPKMFKLVNSKEDIRRGLKEHWIDKCSTNIIKGKNIVLKDSLERYIDNFDFSIVDTYSIEKIIEEHRKTHYFYFRFGGEIKPKREVRISPPSTVEMNEFMYVNKILRVYSETKEECIQLEELHINPELVLDFNRHRANFYCAESLKRCIRDIFTNENEFDTLKEEMYSGISDFITGVFIDGHEKLRRTMHESTKVNLSVSRVDRDLHFVSNDDKKGLCHHLANDDKIDWIDER
jgi:hypothetical protein